MGQALSLPVEDSGIMKSVIQLYQAWLLGRNRPPLLHASYEEEIVKQISAVFELRSDNTNLNTNVLGTNANVCVPPNAPLSSSASSMGGSLADMHVDACIQGLQTLVELCRAGKLAPFWTLAVKVALGIADYILSDERDPAVNYLGHKLSARVLSAFFEILFTSGTRDEEVWEVLPRLAQRWKHRAALISQWSHISWALTSKLIRYLYGPTCGSDSFTLEDGDAKMVSVVFDEEFTLFCWHKIFFLLGDFENIPDQNNYLLALRGIGRIVDLFLHVGGSKNGSTMLVDGNSIFYITGQHLFKAITQFKEYKFDIGKAEAFQIVMKVFEEKRDSTFSSNFLAYFYYGLQQALVKNKYLMGTILNCTKSLFQLELPGSHILIPIYIQSIQYVLTYKQKTMEGLSVSIRDLKMACMRILSYFCSMPSHLYRSQQQLIDSGANGAAAAGHLGKELAASDEFLVLIPQIVVDTLRSHDDQDLLIACLWLGFVFALEALDLPQCASFPSQFANLVINRIVSATSGWEITAITSGLKILSHFAEYQGTPALCQCDLGSVVVINLCKLVETHCTTDNRKDYSDEVVINALDAILAWLVNDTQSTVTKDAKIPVWQKVFDALNIAAYARQSLEGSERSQKFVYPSPKVKETAECVMEQLLCKTSTLGSPTVTFQETDYLEKENLSIKNASCFVAGYTIISLITHPRNEVTNSIKIAAFIRSVSGKFFWEGEVLTSAYDTIFGHNSAKVLSQLSAQPSPAAPSSPPAPTAAITDDKTASISTRLKNCFTSTVQQALYASLLDVAQKQETKRIENGSPTHKSHVQVQKPQRNSPQHPPLIHHPHRQQFHEHTAQPTPQLAPHPQAQQHTPLPPYRLVAHPSSPPKSQPLTPLKVSPLNLDSASPITSIGSPTSLGQQDLTAVRIFLSNLGLISQPPPIAMSTPSSPNVRHRNISHNAPSSPTSTTSGSAQSPAASTSSMLPPSSHAMSPWNHSHANLRVIDLPHANTFDYLFGLLDELRGREFYEISILYVPPTFSYANPDVLFEIPEGSTKFEDFVQAMGWKVRVAEITGYSGIGVGVSPESPENSIYYANNSVEVLYRVSTYLARYRRVTVTPTATPRLETEGNTNNDNAKTVVEMANPTVDKPRPKKGPPPLLSSPPRFANIPGGRTPEEHAKMEQLKKDKRGSFKKSMSVSGGMGFNTIPSRDMMSSSTNVRAAAQNTFRKTSFGDEENIHTLASRKKLLTTSKVLILWAEGLRAAAHLSTHPRPPTTPNGNNLLQLIGSRALISIIIFPLKSGLFHIRVVKKPTVLLGPLLDDIVVSFQQLPHLVRFTAINACRALNDPDSPRPTVIRKNVIEEFAKPSGDQSFYHFYSPYFSATK
eukprot:Phypoly_transcript_00484.p1 GENE.Phypoly_transcript_00484~~Phypoly_transcript_00484.p1  ORF type:complete len:1420 (+),score=227.86 Phypoly_transcript_00484:151-4260(+)